MVRFCHNCGKAVTDDITKVCSNCGTDLINQVSNVPIRITASRPEIFEKAIPFFAAKKYAVRAQTDYLVSFESQDRDVNWLIFVVFCCLGLIPAVIYYYWFTHNHQITLTLSGTTDVSINVIGNTDQAKKDAEEFMKTF
jgi:predicted  nucleic acid-binding Zn-ribbon protein